MRHDQVLNTVEYCQIFLRSLDNSYLLGTLCSQRYHAAVWGLTNNCYCALFFASDHQYLLLQLVRLHSDNVAREDRTRFPVLELYHDGLLVSVSDFSSTEYTAEFALIVAIEVVCMTSAMYFNFDALQVLPEIGIQQPFVFFFIYG